MIFISWLLLAILFNVAQATVFESGSYQGILGRRNYKVYIPTNLDNNKKYPIVMMIHGCEEDAESFAAGTRIISWANKEKFIVLLPEQNIAFNSSRCWNWFLPVNNSKYGEAQTLIKMLDQVIIKYNGDSNRVYTAGMSSGASMVNILGNCYPDRFKALASHAGTQYYASQTGMDFEKVVHSGASVPATIAAQLGYACSAFSVNRPNQMPIIIFHGMNDQLMSSTHAKQVENEFKIFNDLLDNGRIDDSYFFEKKNEFYSGLNTYGYSKFTIINKHKENLIERYMIHDLSHSWSGGDSAYPYNDSKGPDATSFIIEFFKRYGL